MLRFKDITAADKTAIPKPKRGPLQLLNSLWVLGPGCVLVISISSPALAQQVQAPPANQTLDESTTPTDQNIEDEAPALGIIVGSCPGNAVCVLDTVWRSPADEADIRRGDYLISVDDQQVSSPKELCQLVSKLPAGKQVQVKIWRHGEELERQVSLASKAEKRPDIHRAWLGVMLSSSDSEGVVIENVVPDSPAQRGGLKAGDRIIQSNGKDVSDVQSFIESIEQKGPNTEIQLTLQNDDQQREVPVTLGNVSDAPMSFLRQAEKAPIDSIPLDSMLGAIRSLPSLNAQMNEMPLTGPGNQQLTDETLDELRRRIRQLEQQVERLAGSAETKDSDANAPAQSDGEQDKEKGNPPTKANDNKVDLSQSSPSFPATSELTFVAQRGDLYDRGRDQDRFDKRERNRRGFDRRDVDRGWPYGRATSDWRNRYRSDYPSRLDRSPRYGNQYYRYGGQPYYDGNRSYGINPYYNRRGINFGNFGISWF